LEINPRPARFVRQPFGKIERRRAAHILAKIVVELPLKLRVLPRLFVLFGELPQRGHQRLRYVSAAVRTETPIHIRNKRGGARHRRSFGSGSPKRKARDTNIPRFALRASRNHVIAASSVEMACLAVKRGQSM